MELSIKAPGAIKRVFEFLILCLLTALWAAIIFLWLFGGRAIAQTATIMKVDFTSVYDLYVTHGTSRY